MLMDVLLFGLNMYSPLSCSSNFIIEPSRRCTHRVGSIEVSMVTLQTLRTSFIDRIFAIEFGLYHRVPKFGNSPTWYQSWCPPLVIARKISLLSWMFVTYCLLLKTDTVDWVSNNIHSLLMGLYFPWSVCVITTPWYTDGVPLELGSLQFPA